MASDAKLKGLQKKKTLNNPVFYEIKINAKKSTMNKIPNFK